MDYAEPFPCHYAPVARKPDFARPDEALLARAREGNRTALAMLYDIYSPAIYRYLVRRTGDPHLSEDLTGTVFIKLLEAIHRQRTWSTTFVGWLYRIAHNVVVDHFRMAARHCDNELEESIECPTEAPDHLAERAVRLSAIRNALNALTEEQCQVVMLRFGEGLSHVEVGAILGKSEGAAKLLQHRALNVLRRILEQEVL